ncbi:MAG: autoinducer binding domain-containing protein [Gammaproteobacteria bacterium]|nr:autoinducer binding domain-containing protein [Gammaproteobacteria bacterium]
MINLERYESLVEAESLADLHSSCATISKELGFNHFLYGVRVNTSLLQPYQFIFSAYPQTWRNHYDASEYTSIDPTVLHCHTHVVPTYVWENGH